MNTFSTMKMMASITALLMIAGCAGVGGGYGSGMMRSVGTNVLSSVAGNAMGGGVGGTVLRSVIQGMGNNVLNGQIGSQVSQSDQNYRLQQLGGAVNSGTVNQSQQWTNPQTGNTVALNPVGQQTVHPQTQKNCQNMEETATLPNGQRITETRMACQDPQTGKWNLVR
jgi:surface antigen